jgi:hypothetical protein
MEEKEFEFDRKWILDNGIPIVNKYDGNLTLRGLHYQLVNLGMINNLKHYKKVVSAMVKARWDGLLNFYDFVDHDRETIGETEAEITIFDDKVDEAKKQIGLWMTNYSKNRWENQPFYVEVFIEKKALIGAFSEVCKNNKVALNPCKGYPSLTFLYDASERFKEAVENDKEPVIIYFGDYDPSGEDIPRSIKENLSEMGVDVRVERVALMKEQVLEWKLPPAPAKIGDSRTVNWDGLGQVELDAVTPEKLNELCQDAILREFDDDLFDELSNEEDEEEVKFRKELKEYVKGI